MRLSMNSKYTRINRSMFLLAGLGLAAISLAGCSHEDTPKPNLDTTTKPGTTATSAKKKIVFVFKVSGIAYGEACKAGAQQANDDPALNAEVTYQASVEGTAEKQRDIVEQAIVNHVDAIVVSPVDAKAIVQTLKKAKESGIHVFTWDSDSPDSGREFYVAAVDDVQIGADIADAVAKDINSKGKVLIFSGQKTAENLNKHLEGIQTALKKYPGIKIGDPIQYNDDKVDKAKSLALAALQANPDAVGIACTNSPSPRGAAEALRSLNKVGKVKVWGLGLPTENAAYLKEGSISGLYLWNPQTLTYLTAKLVRAALDNKPPTDGQSMTEGTLKVKDGIVTLPIRLEITKANVDSLKF